MRGKTREGSAAKAEAPQKIDDDQAEPPSTSDAAPPPRACLPITPVQIVIRYECLRSPISMCGGHTADRWTPSTPRWGIVRVNSILPARAPRRAGAPLFLLTNYRRARSDSTPKIAYTYLP